MTGVSLTPQEWRHAAQVGLQRQIQALEAGREWRSGGYSCHIEGACAELAVTKYLNVYWQGALVSDPRENRGDVQPGIQVRSTPVPRGRLVLSDRDDARHLYILAVGRAPEFELVGWAWGERVKARPAVPLRTGLPPTYNLPQSELSPLDEVHFAIKEMASRRHALPQVDAWDEPQAEYP